jgi:DNA primase
MDPVAEIKARLDIAEYIGRTVNLQRAGRNLRGLCPFHSEKTPSFYVTPERGTWRCFGTCGEGGDIFTFVQKQTGQDFRGALIELAEAAGVQLDPAGAQQRSRRDHLAAIMSATVDFYQRNLAAPAGEAARAYLSESRGIRDETVEAFRLGWAPDEWRALRDYLLGRGYTDADAVAAGVLVEGEHGNAPYDRFRGRVIIPISDERGVFVALGGRGLHGEQPKYLNSPQTELFDKSKTLFGMNLASESARSTGTIVVVEGYMDVIGPWQAGFPNVVATMGTSLTEDHAALLRRFARRIVLAMDPDAAGQAATERAGTLFATTSNPAELGRAARSATRISEANDVELRVATMPAGQDPDDVAREHPEVWESSIANAKPYVEFLIERALPNTRPDSPVEVRRLLAQVSPILNGVNSPIERARYVGSVARHLGIREEDVQRALAPQQRPYAAGPARRWDNAPLAGTSVVQRTSHEEVLLAVILRYPSMRAAVASLPKDIFSDARNRAIFSHWLADDTADSASPGDPAISEHERYLREIRLPVFNSEDASKAANQNIQAILDERRDQRFAALIADMEELERDRGATEVAEITYEAWRTGRLSDETDEKARAVMESLALGQSRHRKESPHTGARR